MVAVIFRFCFYEANAGEDFASLQKITLDQKSRNPVRENTNLLSITVLYPETENKEIHNDTAHYAWLNGSSTSDDGLHTTGILKHRTTGDFV